MEKFDAIIIGSGLGGLVSGNILSKEGLKVCVLEKNGRIGGTLQSFAKEGTIFNTGLNYTESLGKGEILYRYFNYLGLMDALKIQRLDIDSFDKISFGNDDAEYHFAQGHDYFVERLTEYFPKERENLQNYIHQMGAVCNSFPLYSLDASQTDFSVLEKQQSVSAFLKSCTSNQKLQKVLAGMSSLYAGVEDETPMYIHSLINYSFIKSAWRFVNGSSQLATLLAKGIAQNGGIVQKKSKVVALGGQENRITHVCLENGEQLQANWIISNIHPASTLKLLPDGMVRKAYNNRILSLQNSVGMFSLYLVLKKESLKQFNFNVHHFPNSNVWGTNYIEKNWPEHFMLYSPANSKAVDFANGLVVLSYMKFEELKKWQNTTRFNRPPEYYDFKNQKSEILLDAVSKKFPNIRGHIKSVYSATPLTYLDYTGTPEGSAYGIKKNAENPMLSLILPRAKIGNLLFTGQNLNMHGILGVTISAVACCQEIVGNGYLFNKIRNF
ncbi:MAG TPA: FAD-dependent oxidoreductase [Draconibacterium sp.]|nr:FAD-dependent oxidoreductase [Draconibacterium sp.]